AATTGCVGSHRQASMLPPATITAPVSLESTTTSTPSSPQLSTSGSHVRRGATVTLRVDDCPPSDINQRDTVFFHDSYNLAHAKDSDRGLSVLPRSQTAPRVVTSSFTVP